MMACENGVIEPFQGTDQVLQFAFRTEARGILKGSSLVPARRRGRSVSFGGPWDNLAQAALILTAVGWLDPYDALTVRVFFTPQIGITAARKVEDVTFLAHTLMDDLNVDRSYSGFVDDTVREWARLPARFEQQHWCDQLNISRMTLHRIARGRPDRSQRGVIHLLNDRLESARAVLRGVFQDQGLVP